MTDPMTPIKPPRGYSKRRREELLALLRANRDAGGPGLTADDLAAATGVTPHHIRRCMWVLEGDHLIVTRLETHEERDARIALLRRTIVRPWQAIAGAHGRRVVFTAAPGGGGASAGANTGTGAP